MPTNLGQNAHMPHFSTAGVGNHRAYQNNEEGYLTLTLCPIAAIR
jgi:hypothetical protein